MGPAERSDQARQQYRGGSNRAPECLGMRPVGRDVLRIARWWVASVCISNASMHSSRNSMTWCWVSRRGFSRAYSNTRVQTPSTPPVPQARKVRADGRGGGRTGWVPRPPRFAAERPPILWPRASCDKLRCPRANIRSRDGRFESGGEEVRDRRNAATVRPRSLRQS